MSSQDPLRVDWPEERTAQPITFLPGRKGRALGVSVNKQHGIGGTPGDPRWREFSDVLAAAPAAAVGLIPTGGAGGRTRRRFHPGSLNSQSAACRAALFLPAEPWRNMKRHQSRLHHSTQGSAARAPYPSAASLRSCGENKMQRRKDPQHPPQPGGPEVPGEKRPKFVSVAWGGSTAAPAQQVGCGSGPRTLQFHWVYRAWRGGGASFCSRFPELPIS